MQNCGVCLKHKIITRTIGVMEAVTGPVGTKPDWPVPLSLAPPTLNKRYMHTEHCRVSLYQSAFTFLISSALLVTLQVTIRNAAGLTGHHSV